MTTDATKSYPFHGKHWLKTHEEKLQALVQEKKSWTDIAYALGRTPSACKARLAMIQSEPSKPKQASINTPLLFVSETQHTPSREGTAKNTLAAPKQDTETEHKIPWPATDELLLVQLRAIKMPYNDIVDLLSVRRTPGSISSYYSTLKNKNMGFLDDYYIKIGHPYASTNNSARGPSTNTIPTTGSIDGKVKDHASKKVDTNNQIEGIVDGIENLRLKHPLGYELHQQRTPSVGPCHYCHRSTTASESHQLLCLQCKSVLEQYTPDTLLQLMQSVNISAKNHIPISEKDRQYILDIEYERYMTIDIPKRIQGGIEIERPRASHGTFLNIASMQGLTDVYTNIQGHWIHQQDSWDHLKFAYFKTEQGKVGLKPALSIIAHLATSSTDEDIKDWIGAFLLIDKS